MNIVRQFGECTPSNDRPGTSFIRTFFKESYLLYSDGYVLRRTNSLDFLTSNFKEVPQDSLHFREHFPNLPDYTENKAEKKCECDSKTLLWQGCQCGGK